MKRKMNNQIEFQKYIERKSNIIQFENNMNERINIIHGSTNSIYIHNMCGE